MVAKKRTGAPSHEAGRNIYETGDQKNLSNDEKRELAEKEWLSRHAHDGQFNTEKHTLPRDEALSQVDPLRAATAQGHKPSRGAEVDKEIEEDDAEVLKMKDKAAGKTNPEPYLK